MDKSEPKTDTSNDSFLVFGDTSNLEINNQDNAIIITPEIHDFSTKSLEEICLITNFNVITEDTTIKTENILLKNRYVCFYDGSNNTHGEVSIIILNGLTENKQDFGCLLLKIKKLNDLNIKYNLRTIGIKLLENSALLIFERISMNLQKKLSETQIDELDKYIFMFHLIDFIGKLHENQITSIDLREDTILFDKDFSFKFLLPFPEFKKLVTVDLDPDTRFNRFSSPEMIQGKNIGIENDIWVIGCIFLEIFSSREVWSGIEEETIKEDLRKNYVPKIHGDIPKNSWGVICECLNPFPDTRIEAKELLYKYSLICKKLKITKIITEITYVIENQHKILSESTILNESVIVNEETTSKITSEKIEEITVIHQEEKKEENIVFVLPEEVKKCIIHPKYEAFLFCGQCNDIVCETCKKTTHSDHAGKGLVYEYLEFINIARNRSHSYKEKFERYIEACNIPKIEDYEWNIKLTEEILEKQFIDQKTKIEEEYSYMTKRLEELKSIELDNLSKFKESFILLNEKNKENYHSLLHEIHLVEQILKDKEETFLKFQYFSQDKKEEIMKNVYNEEEDLSNKKKNIIRFILNFQKETSQINKVSRFYEIFIEKHIDKNTKELVKTIDEKYFATKKNSESLEFNECLTSLRNEFETQQVFSSRNYFSSYLPKELYISVVNTNKVFSYNIDTDKYSLTEIDFKGMPIQKFPSYSRSIVINGNLLVNGGYSDELKATLPYFFMYDKNIKIFTRLTDMLYGHSAHSIIFIPPHYIVVVSGSGIRKTEKYDMETNCWHELPEISIPRQNTTLYYYNRQYLYAFGGAYWDEKDKTFAYLSTVERLDLGFGSIEGGKDWEVMKTCSLSNNLNIRKSVMTAISYNASKVLLIGGSVGNNLYSDECLLFNFERNEFSKKENLVLPKRTCFPQKFFMYCGNNRCYQLDNDGHVYAFDISLEKFHFVKENSSKSK